MARVVEHSAPQALRTQLGKLDETRTFNPTLLNEFSVAINRFYSDTNSNTPTPLIGFGGFSPISAHCPDRIHSIR